MNLIALLTECYLTEGYPEAQRDFSLTASPEDVATAIAAYKDLVNRNQVQGNERNIDYWRKQGWDLFVEFIATKSQLRSKTQEKRSKVPGKSIILEETPEWLIVVPLDKDASCYHGKNTDWCTAKPLANNFEQYFYNDSVVLVYFLRTLTGQKWAIACHDDTDKLELFDQQDNSITVSSFKTQTGLDPEKYQVLALSTRSTPKFVDTKALYSKMLDVVTKAKPFVKIDTEVERALLFVKNVTDIIDYCKSVKGRWAEAEKFLIRDVNAIYQYALHVIGDRWKAAEPFLLKQLPSNLTSFVYATDIIHNRWPEAERIIEQYADDPAIVQTLRQGAYTYMETYPQWILSTPTDAYERNMTMVMDSRSPEVIVKIIPAHELKAIFGSSANMYYNNSFPLSKLEEATKLSAKLAEDYDCPATSADLQKGIAHFNHQLSHIHVRNLYVRSDDQHIYLIALHA